MDDVSYGMTYKAYVIKCEMSKFGKSSYLLYVMVEV